MLAFLSRLTVNTTEIICMYVVAVRLFGMALNKNKVAMAALGILNIFSAVFYAFLWEKGPILQIILYILPIIFFSLLMIRGKWYRVILMGLYTIIFCAIWDELAGSLLLLTTSIFNWESHIVLRYMICSIITMVFVLLLGMIYGSKTRAPFKNISIFGYLFILFISTINLIICLFVVEFNEIEESTPSFKIVSAIIVISMYIQLALLLHLADSRNYHLERDVLNQNYLALQKEHFLYLQEKESKIRKFRHDIAHHIFILERLLEEEKIEEAVLYLKRMNEYVSADRNRLHSNNDIVDAILNKSLSEADKIGAQIKVSGRIPAECYVEAFDLCTIFANLLSNALEAVVKADQKEIEITIRYDEENIYICEENAYAIMPEHKNGRFLTQKEDKENHGLGLQNLKDSVLKYGGNVDHGIRDNHFFILIRLPNKQ